MVDILGRKVGVMDKTAIIIPARWGSTRFPGKPLVEINGKVMIQWVYDACKKSNADDVFVATDSEKIYKAVESFGGKCIMTGECKTGTDRVIQATEKLPKDYKYIVNIQGDEPGIHAREINNLIKTLHKNHHKVATLVTRMTAEQKLDRNVVKAYVENREIQMFTRSPIYGKCLWFFRHIGVYGFSRFTLNKIKTLTQQTDNELGENLEQLRWCDSGVGFVYDVTNYSAKGVDTVADVEKMSKHLKTIS